MANDATKVVFEKGFADARPTSCHAWFLRYFDLKTIEGIENLNTSAVTNMNSMFMACTGLETLDLRKFDVSKVTNATTMFRACSKLTTIYCNDTWDIETTVQMFDGATKLKGAVSYDSNHVDGAMANPDTGYFTRLYDPGDINGDGVVDVADVNALVNIIMGKARSEDYPGLSNLNNDGQVDVSDVNLLINIVLGKQ